MAEARETKGNKVGLFGGSFDPIHFGHLNLAMELKEKHHLDEVWFCPAHINPHKLDANTPALALHRLKMVELAVAGIPGFRVIDNEISREGPSYTIDTLHALIADEAKTGNGRTFALLLGADAIPGFFRWHCPLEIVRLVPLFIGSRAGTLNISQLEGDPEILAAIQKGMTETRLFDVSATAVRYRLSKGLYCGHLVPKEVLDYIYTNHLYS